jgi:ankyrin repeat protein
MNKNIDLWKIILEVSFKLLDLNDIIRYILMNKKTYELIQMKIKKNEYKIKKNNLELKIEKIKEKRDLEEIMKYNINTNFLEKIYKKKIIKNDLLMIIIINNFINLEEEYKKYKWRPIHFICRYSTEKMIKYIIEKEINLKCETKCGWRPIYLICNYSTLEMIKYVIEKMIKKNKKTNLLSLELSKILKIIYNNINLTKKERKIIRCKIISEIINNK